MKRIGIAFVLAAALMVVMPTSAMAITPERPHRSMGLKLLDVLLVRPICVPISIASTVVGSVLTLFTWPMGVADEVVSYTIVAPWRFTSSRYIGDFRYYEDGGTIMGANIQD